MTEIVCCAQQKVRLGIIGDWSGDGYKSREDIQDMLRLTLDIIDPDPTCEPGNLWLSRDDALHLADVLRTFAVTLERVVLQCQVAWPDNTEDAKARKEDGNG